MAKKRKKRKGIRWGRILVLLVILSLVLGLLGWGCTKVYFHFFPTLQMQVEQAWEETDMDKDTKKTIKKLTKDDPYSEAALRIIKNYSDYSSEIFEYGLKDTDRLEYVSLYPEKLGTEYDGDLGELDITHDVPKLIQWDTRWGYQYYGDDTIAIAGCAPTCMAMILYHFIEDIEFTPAVLANDAMTLGLYEYGAGTSWSFFNVVANAVEIGCYQDDNVTASSIKENLKAGNKLILSMNPGDFTATGHFIVAAGINDDGTIDVHDPNSKKRTEKHWDAKVLAEQARAMFVFY
ncbi:MAG: C39 family peptidase [Firmicutes bacterium]|nr:C39 family peptidase [Bacillota bacterium]